MQSRDWRALRDWLLVNNAAFRLLSKLQRAYACRAIMRESSNDDELGDDSELACRLFDQPSSDHEWADPAVYGDEERGVLDASGSVWA